MSHTSRFALFAAAGFMAVTLTAAPKDAAACGTEAYTGQVCVIAGNYCPNNTVEAQGQLLPINQYQALYSLLATTYGGDGRVNFGIPDLRGRAPVGQGQGPGLTAHPIGEKYGQEAVAQTAAMLAQHTHGATFTASGGSGTPSATIAIPVVGGTDGTTNTPSTSASLAKVADVDLSSVGGTSAPVNAYSTAAADTTLKPFSAPVTGSVTGGVVNVAASTAPSQQIPTVAPRIAVRYCIVLNGIYPPRP